MRTLKMSVATVLVAFGVGAVGCKAATEDDADSATGASTENAALTEIYTAKSTDAIEHLVVREDGIDPATKQVRRTLFFATAAKGASGDATIQELHHTGAATIATLASGMFEMAIYGADSAENASSVGRTVYAVPQGGGLKHTVTKKAADGTASASFVTDLPDAEDAVITSVAASTNGVFVGRDDGKILQLGAKGTFSEVLDTHLADITYDDGTTSPSPSLPRQLQVIESADHTSARLYWVDREPSDDKSSGDTVIASVALVRPDTAGPFQIAANSKPVVLAHADHATTLATDGKELFFTAWGLGEGGDEGYVGKVDATGTSRKLVEGVRRPSSIAVDDAGVYFTTGQGPDDDSAYRGGAVMIIDRASFTKPEGEAPVRCFKATQGTAPAKLTLSGTNVFWVENAASNANKLPEGGDPDGTHTGIFVWDKEQARSQATSCEAREASRDATWK